MILISLSHVCAAVLAQQLQLYNVTAVAWSASDDSSFANLDSLLGRPEGIVCPSQPLCHPHSPLINAMGDGGPL
jgi:hypothetical protein